MSFGLNRRSVLYIILGLVYLLFVIILFVGAGLITQAIFEGKEEYLKELGIDNDKVKICRFTMIITWFLYILIFFALPIYFIFMR